MTVSTTTRRSGPYTGNGVTTSFAVGFKFLAEDLLRVVRLNTTTGVETVLTETTDYVRVGAGNPSGGSITTTVAPTATQTITILGDLDFTQETDYIENDPFPAEAHETALDKATMLIQQQQEEIDRAIKQAPSAAVSDIIFPEPEASAIIGWNTGGTALENKTLASVSTTLDTVFTGLAADDMLQYDGSVFVNRTPAQIRADVLPDGDYADIVVSASGSTFTIDNSAVTTAKIAANAVDGTKIAMGSDAQGDTLYFNGTDYARLPAGTSGQFLKTNGAGANPAWATPSTIATYTSSDQTITSGGSITLTHGLGGVPDMVDAYLVCQTAEQNYSIGDIVQAWNGLVVSTSCYSSPTVTATEIIWRYSAASGSFVLTNKTTGAGFIITNANWKLRTKALKW